MPSTRQSIYQTDQIVIKKLYANRQKTGVSHNPGAKSTQERLGTIPGRPRSVPEPPGNVPGASQERLGSALERPRRVPERGLRAVSRAIFHDVFRSSVCVLHSRKRCRERNATGRCGTQVQKPDRSATKALSQRFVSTLPQR